MMTAPDVLLVRPAPLSAVLRPLATEVRRKAGPDVGRLPTITAPAYAGPRLPRVGGGVGVARAVNVKGLRLTAVPVGALAVLRHLLTASLIPTRATRAGGLVGAGAAQPSRLARPLHVA